MNLAGSSWQELDDEFLFGACGDLARSRRDGDTAAAARLDAEAQRHLAVVLQKHLALRVHEELTGAEVDLNEGDMSTHAMQADEDVVG